MSLQKLHLDRQNQRKSWMNMIWIVKVESESKFNLAEFFLKKIVKQIEKKYLKEKRNSLRSKCCKMKLFGLRFLLFFFPQFESGKVAISLVSLQSNPNYGLQFSSLAIFFSGLSCFCLILAAVSKPWKWGNFGHQHQKNCLRGTDV